MDVRCTNCDKLLDNPNKEFCDDLCKEEYLESTEGEDDETEH